MPASVTNTINFILFQSIQEYNHAYLQLKYIKRTATEFNLSRIRSESKFKKKKTKKNSFEAKSNEPHSSAKRKDFLSHFGYSQAPEYTILKYFYCLL